MSRLLKVFAAVVGTAVLVQVALFLWIMYSATVYAKPSEIIDFNPTSFSAKADVSFFFSMADELKFSDQINSDAPTLLHGKISNFLVAPNEQLIAVVSNGVMQVISGDGSVKHVVTPVSSIYKEPKPIGVQFFRDDNFQWSRDSRSIYLIKDEYYQPQRSQLFSTHGELWKYNLETGKLQLVLKPFSAYSYFLVDNSGVYFSEPVSTGDLQLKYFDGNASRNIDKPGAREIPADQLPLDVRESIFFSFSINDYERAILPRKGVRLTAKNGEQQELMAGSKVLLALTVGQGFKGPYYGSEMLRSVFLPGDRYFLFNVNCGNYDGQLLFDTSSGNYMTLPKGTEVYLPSNTNTFHDYHISSSGIEVQPYKAPSITEHVN